MSTLIQRIKAEKPSTFSFNQQKISFSGGSLRFVSSWNLLTSISYGEINILPVMNTLLVSYKLWFTGLFIFALFATAIFGLLIFPSGFTIQNIALVTAIWLWFFGGNFIITVIRFHVLVRSAIGRKEARGIAYHKPSEKVDS